MNLIKHHCHKSESLISNELLKVSELDYASPNSISGCDKPFCTPRDSKQCSYTNSQSKCRCMQWTDFYVLRLTTRCETDNSSQDDEVSHDCKYWGSAK